MNQKRTRWKSLLVKDIYSFDVFNGKLSSRVSFPARRVQNIAEQYLDLIHAGQALEEEFFVNLKSLPNQNRFGGFISTFGFPRPPTQFDRLFTSPLPDGTTIEEVSTKWFRRLDLLPLESLPSSHPSFSKFTWNKFWDSSIPHQARGILWRLYYSKFPSRSHLHPIMPSHIPDASCTICGAVETDEHFLWSCPIKR